MIKHEMYSPGKIKAVLFILFCGLTLCVMAQKTPYGPWVSSECYKGLDYSVRNAGYNSSAKKYTWYVKFRNRYRYDIHFAFVLKEGTAKSANPNSRMTIPAGMEEEGTWFLVADGNNVRAFIRHVRFGNEDKGAYAICDDGNPTYAVKQQTTSDKPANGIKPGSSVTSSNTNSTKPSNSGSGQQPTTGNNSQSTTGQPSTAEVERQRQEAYRKQQEEYRRKQEEHFRQEEQRYQQQLQQITQKSESRAQRDAAIMDGFAGILSVLEKNKAEKGLKRDAGQRARRIEEYKRKLSTGEYELIDCASCRADGLTNCGQCRSQGRIKCTSCNGEAGGTCSSCRGTGKTLYGPYQLSCNNCSGTGQKKCLPCSNQGFNICFLCHGRSQLQCDDCDGTGMKLKMKRNSTSGGASSNNQPDGNDEAISPALLQQQLAIDSSIVSDYGFCRKPVSLKPGVDSVYYIGFKRPYNKVDNGTLTLKLFAVYRYSDGSFPLLTDIQEKSKHKPQTSELGSTRLLGYFESVSAAQKAMDQIVQRARSNGINVACERTPVKMNPTGKAPAKTEDFWNN